MLEEEIETHKKESTHSSFLQNIDVTKDFHVTFQMLQKQLNFPLDDLLMITGNTYTAESFNSLENKSINPKNVIYILKQNLIEAGILNH